MDQMVANTNSRIIDNCADIKNISERLLAETSQLKSYINDKVNIISSDFPTTLAKMGNDVDTKLSRISDKIKSYIDSKVSLLPRLSEIEKLCDNAIQNEPGYFCREN